MLLKLSVTLFLSLPLIGLCGYVLQKVEVPQNLEGVEVFTDETIADYDGSDVSKFIDACRDRGLLSSFLQRLLLRRLHFLWSQLRIIFSVDSTSLKCNRLVYSKFQLVPEWSRLRIFFSVDPSPGGSFQNPGIALY